MAMNVWEILEIESTTDSRKIKKAYAKKLRTIIPDEQPEEFQKLKTAFDTAILFTKKNVETSSSVVFFGEDVIDTEEIDIQTIEAKEDIEIDTQSIEIEEDIKIADLPFTVKLQLLLNEKDYAYNLHLWKKLTESMDDWSIDEFMANSYSIQLFLAEHFKRISKEIIHFLFYVFELLELTDYIGQENYVFRDFIILKNEIYSTPALSFDITSIIEESVKAEYLDLRYSIYYMIKFEEDFYEIKYKLDRAKQLFSNDSDLYNLYILNILQEYHGYPKSELNLKIITDLIKQAAEGQENDTTKFLKTYIMMLKNGKKNQMPQEKIVWKKEQLVIPEKLYALLMGYYFFFNQNYTAAFVLWKRLPLENSSFLNDSMKKIGKQLPSIHAKEYAELIKKAKKTQKIKTKVKPSNKRSWELPEPAMWALLLGIVSMFFKFVVFNDSNTNTNHTKLNSEQYKQIIEFNKEERTDELLAIEEHSIEKSFIETFYLSSQVEKKEQFKSEYMEDNVSIDDARQLNNLSKFNHAVLSDFSIKKNEDKDYTVIYYKGEPVNINQFTSNKKLGVVYGEGWERVEEYPPIGLDDLELPVDSFAETFIYIFYLVDNPLLRDIFRLNVTNDESLQKQMRDFVPAESYQGSSINDFSFNTKEENGSSKIVYIRYKEQPFSAFAYYAWDSGEHIIGIVGDQWDFPGEYSLKVIDCEQAAKIFVQYILYSDQKQENFVKYREYFSENIQSLIESGDSLTVPTNLDNTDLYYSEATNNLETNKEPLFFLGYGREPRLFFTFDGMGRLDHVYGEQWQTGIDRIDKNSINTHIQSVRGIRKGR